MRLFSSPARWCSASWKRQKCWTQRSLSSGRFIVVLQPGLAVVLRLEWLVWLAGVELVLTQLVAIGCCQK